MVGRRRPDGLRIDNRASRLRGPAPESTGSLGNCPADASPEVRSVWKMIAEESPTRVLTKSDRMHVRVLAELYVQFLANPAEFSPGKLTTLNRMMQQIGLGASGRLHLALPLSEEPREPNPFDEFHT